MAQLVRGYGSTKLGPLVLPRAPLPSLTTIPCPSYGGLIEIGYEDVAREISRAIRKEY
jgi:hypothetical protein